MATSVASTPTNVRRIALDLHTDIANLETYAGQPAIVGPLLETAENKVAIILQHFFDVRAAAGLRPSVLLRAVREG